MFKVAFTTCSYSSLLLIQQYTTLLRHALRKSPTEKPVWRFRGNDKFGSGYTKVGVEPTVHLSKKSAHLACLGWYLNFFKTFLFRRGPILPELHYSVYCLLLPSSELLPLTARGGPSGFLFAQVLGWRR